MKPYLWVAGCYSLKSVNRDWVRQNFIDNPVPFIYSNSCDHAIHNWLYRIVEHRDIKSVLDVGCGKGHDCDGIHQAGSSYMGLDPIPINIKTARDYFGDFFTEGYVQDLPFDDDSFDCVFMFSVWETLPKDTKQVAIEECCRVAKEYVINIDAGFPPMHLRERWGYVPSGWHPTLTRVVDTDQDKYFTIWDITHNTYKCPVLV